MTTTLSAERTFSVRLDATIQQSAWSGLYDRLEVWRSVLGKDGPYEELTASRYTAARVPMNAGEPDAGIGANVNIADKVLRVLVGETELQITLSGPNPKTFSAVATEVTSKGLGLVRAFVDVQGRFVLETIAVGGHIRLEVLKSDAAALLHLPIETPNSVGYGKDPRIPLIESKQVYSFTDYFGKTSYYYKVRPRNSLTGVVGAFSGPISAVPSSGISEKNLVTGYVNLVRSNGQPAVKQQVTVYTSDLGFQIEGKTLIPEQQTFLTDNNGYMEVRLVRGSTVDVSIGGMDLMRRIVVPTDSSIESFDMLDPAYGADDTFAVKRINIPYAEKRNL